MSGVLQPVARSVSATSVRVVAAVQGITSGIWLLWRLRRHAGLWRAARLGDPVFTHFMRCGVVRCPVRPLFPRRGLGDTAGCIVPRKSVDVVATILSFVVFASERAATVVALPPSSSPEVWGLRSLAFTIHALP